MTWWVALTGGMVLLLSLFLMGVPIFAAFVVLNVIGVFVFFGASGFGLFANSIYATATLGALSAVPLFIVMGEILFRSGAMDVLFDSLDRLIGRIRGRQYVLCIVLSAILGALSGAAMAVAGLLGRSLFPTMRKRGYDTQFSAGTILAGASLDPIIPPSVLAVIVATLADVSAGKMLVAGILPGLLLTGMFLAYVIARVRVEPSLAPDVAADTVDRKSGSALLALVRIVPSAFVFFMVMGLIMLGIATPTEAAATGVLGAILLATYYRGLSWRMLTDALFSAATVASLLLIIMCSAVMFSQLLTFTGATRALGQFVVDLNLSGALMLFAMLALPFVLFMFLDQLALMLVLIPIYQPIIRIYDFDPIWFWTLFLVAATVGGLTPPFGYVLFALKSAAPDVPMTTIFRASWPFVWIICLGMLIMALVPDIITLLPRLMGPK
jgi:tripartite ATP-independent transporter DctM subunit